MKVSVDVDKCCGAGQCVLAAPDVFDQRDDDGIVILLDAAPPADQHDNVRKAAAVCPAAAIEVHEAGLHGTDLHGTDLHEIGLHEIEVQG
ncbi:ferredoxin [Frankia sp. AiPs1]|nr:ferredoxin [Frankia sp. AiPs1]MCM3922693.1 ferredoxin [Frankia sp. AiPs1]